MITLLILAGFIGLFCGALFMSGLISLYFERRALEEDILRLEDESDWTDWYEDYT